MTSPAVMRNGACRYQVAPAAGFRGWSSFPYSVEVSTLICRGCAPCPTKCTAKAKVRREPRYCLDAPDAAVKDRHSVMSRPSLSVVLPVCNEEANLTELQQRLESALQGTVDSYEILYINDSSTDGSQTVLENLVATHSHVRVLLFSRNFGHQVAMTAGLDHALGDAIITMDSDLQDPPELIPELLEKWREGYDVVYTQRRRRLGESWFKRVTAFLFYRFLGVVASVHVRPDVGDFRLLSRKAIDTLNRMGEKRRFLRGLTSWIGFRATNVLYDRPARTRGESNYHLMDMIRLALTATFSFSRWPLTAIGILGLLVCLGSAAPLLAGGSALASGLFFLGGVQLLCLWVVGDYIAMIADEVRGRPLYILESELQSAAAGAAKDTL